MPATLPRSAIRYMVAPPPQKENNAYNNCNLKTSCIDSLPADISVEIRMDSPRLILYIYNFFIDKLQFCNIFQNVERYSYPDYILFVYIFNF